MLLRHWTTLVFSLWAWGVDSSQQDSGSGTQCHITPNPDPQYVAAYVMHYRPGRGCYSNSSSPSHQLVHVINLKLDDIDDVTKRRPVSLKIEPKDFSTKASKDLAEEDKKLEVHQRMLVFVFNSKWPVKLKVEISGKFQAHARQLFLVPNHSSIRFKKRKARAHMRGRRRKMPRAEDEHSFLSWVKQKFKAVTSYSEVDGDKLLFYVGQEIASTDCRLNDMKPSPYAMIAHMEKQAVSGCTSVGKKIVLDRPVYIIELQGIPEGHSKTKQRVELDIVSSSGKKMELKFYLILRSPDYVKWVLTSHRIQGRIDVLTDADADVRGIRMHTVALRREVIELSGSDLIRWAEYYTAPVRAYASVASANFLQLLLPYNDSDSLTLWNEDPVMLSQSPGQGVSRRKSEGSSTGGPTNDMREHLRHIIKTRCEGGMMEVALPTALTQELDMSVEQLSLLDRRCRASKNRTHVIFRTALDQCKTRRMSFDDEDVYSNAIVIHASGVLGAILEEELGSGYFDLQATSGSGWMESDGDGSDTPYVDDEDYASRKVEIDVECRVPWSGDGGVDQGSHGSTDHEALAPDTCELWVYDDPRLQHHVIQFPHTASSATGIYIQATAPKDKRLHVLMEYCWVTRWKDPQVRDDQQAILVQQGCTRSPGTNWVPYETGHRGQEIPPECLMIYRHLPQGSHVHCQLSVCYKGSLAPGQKCPPDPSDHCNSNVLPNMFPRLQMRSCGVHSVGPLEVTDGEVHIMGEPISTRTTKPIIANSGGSKQFKTDSGPQQSVIIEGLDSGTVVGIAFAAFAIGIMLMGGLWFIHTHTGPSKRGMTAVSGTSGDVTPNSSSPISA